MTDHRRKRCDRASWTVFPTREEEDDADVGDWEEHGEHDDYDFLQLLILSLSLTTTVDGVQLKCPAAEAAAAVDA